MTLTAPAEGLRPHRRARLRPIVTAGRVLVLVIALAGGFVVVAQLRGAAKAKATLAGDSPEDLTRILASLNAGVDGLNAEVTNLKLELLSLQTSTQRDAAAEAAAADRLRSLQVLSGTVPVFGPGIEARIDDPRGLITYDLLIGAVEELRDSGAEALSINGHRLGAASWLGGDNGHIVVDQVPVAPPYVISAVGDPATLDSGLKIPGGAVDSLTAVPAVSVDIHRQARLDLPALEHPPTFSVARPVGSTP